MNNNYESIQTVDDIPAYSTFVAAPLAIIGLPFLIIGIIIGLIWDWIKIGMATGWWIARRMESWVKLEKNKF